MNNDIYDDIPLTEDEKDNEKINEFIAMVKNSNLFTIFIEGSDDVVFYEPLEALCEEAPKTIDITPVGGRKIALGIFNGLKDTQYINKVVFIVDMDTWVYLGKPAEYLHERLISTFGYSIENDIYIDFDFCQFMKSLRVYGDFIGNLENYLDWYVIAIKRVLEDTVISGDTLDIHPKDFFDNNRKENLTILRASEEVDTELLNSLKLNFKQTLRGKNLLNLALYVVNKKPNSSRYTNKSIAQLAVHNKRGPNLNRIFENAKDFAMQGF